MLPLAMAPEAGAAESSKRCKMIAITLPDGSRREYPGP
jgi:hypothetical protein